ncbi:MAG: hypothetical protein AABW63_01770 [Nanoarchaeota archaeon]
MTTGTLTEKTRTELPLVKIETGCQYTNVCGDNLELRFKIAQGRADDRYRQLSDQHNELCTTVSHTSCSIYKMLKQGGQNGGR